MSDDKNPLSRWSQRKLAARRGGELAAEAPPPEPPTRAGEPQGGEPEVPVLPSIDDLDAQSDYTVFLRKNVPEGLKRAALRKLWTSDPVLANLDGLNHYDDDYNVIDQTISLAQTGYDPEWGHLGRPEDKQRDAEREISESTPRTEPDTDALSENAAATPEAMDAPRQVASTEPDAPVADSSKEAK